jgi:putative oxidoreductase
MSFRTPQSSPGITLARLLLASLLIVMGAWRLWNVVQGGKSSGEMLSFSVAGLLVGLAVAGGWRLRWSALLAAALVLAEAVLWHPFWSQGEPARSAQLLHFMKNAALAGGFLLLSLTAPTRRR